MPRKSRRRTRTRRAPRRTRRAPRTRAGRTRRSSSLPKNKTLRRKVNKSNMKKKKRKKRGDKQVGGLSARDRLTNWTRYGRSKLSRLRGNEPDKEASVTDNESQSENEVDIFLNDTRDATPDTIYKLYHRAWLRRHNGAIPNIYTMKMKIVTKIEDTDIPGILHRWSECEHRDHTGKKHSKSLSWNDQGRFKRGPRREKKGHHCGRCGRPICLEHQSTGAGSVSFAPSTGHALPSKWCQNCVDRTEEERKSLSENKRGTVNQPSHKEPTLALNDDEKFGREKSVSGKLPGSSEFWNNRPGSTEVIELPIPAEWEEGVVPPALLKALREAPVYISVVVDPEWRPVPQGVILPQPYRDAPPPRRSRVEHPVPIEDAEDAEDDEDDEDEDEPLFEYAL